jgi:hypothetical protein
MTALQLPSLDHRTVCRFKYRFDPAYCKVLEQLTRLREKLLGNPMAGTASFQNV